jgi:hypothetical protein
MKKVWGTALAVFVLFASPAMAAKPGGGGGAGCPTLNHDPILFVHGWNSSSST